MIILIPWSTVDEYISGCKGGGKGSLGVSETTSAVPEETTFEFAWESEVADAMLDFSSGIIWSSPGRCVGSLGRQGSHTLSLLVSILFSFPNRSSSNVASLGMQGISSSSFFLAFNNGHEQWG